MKIRYQTSKICCFAFSIFIFDFLTLSSSYAWKLPIEVATLTESGEKVYNRLVIGVESGATEGFDNLWDAPALLSRPDPDSPLALRAYLTPPPILLPQGGAGQGGGEETEMGRLWKDIRGPIKNGTTSWEITVDSVPEGKRVVITWDIPQNLFKGGERLILKDNGKTAADGEEAKTDMTQTASYEFVSDGVGVRSLSLAYSKDGQSSTSGSGFGCGTIKPDKGGPPDDGAAATSMVLLLLPIGILKLIKLIQLTRLRLSI